MHTTPSISASTRPELYKELLAQLESVLSDESNFIANLANTCALFYHQLNEHKVAVNWFGFYLVDKRKPTELVLGPFQGLLACTRIPFTRGVCGHCATTRETVIVANVHEFKGHIACDSASNSEICVPLIDTKGELLGLIDVDSSEFSTFDQEDKQALESVAQLLIKYSDLHD